MHELLKLFEFMGRYSSGHRQLLAPLNLIITNSKKQKHPLENIFATRRVGRKMIRFPGAAFYF